MIFQGPVSTASTDVERILRSLPAWFGIEESLLGYVRDATVHPTFLAIDQGPVAFLTARQHFPEAWEVHCIAVHAGHRGQGLGRALHAHVEAWLVARGAELLQVKTLAESHPSPEYAQTRAFYRALGYRPVEVFPQLWGPRHPVLQLLKPLRLQA